MSRKVSTPAISENLARFETHAKSTGLEVSEYVPAVGKILGVEKPEEQAPVTETKVGGPPDRPHHDTQIEEFVRDQHRSRPEDAIPEE